MVDQPTTLLNVRQVANHLGCSVANVYALMNRGNLPFVSIGKSKGYRVKVEDLQAFIAGRSIQHELPKPTSRRPRLKHLKF